MINKQQIEAILPPEIYQTALHDGKGIVNVSRDFYQKTFGPFPQRWNYTTGEAFQIDCEARAKKVEATDKILMADSTAEKLRNLGFNVKMVVDSYGFCHADIMELKA